MQHTKTRNAYKIGKIWDRGTYGSTMIKWFSEKKVRT
jgi:hypothetical protein